MATLPENPQWEAKALADIADGSTLIIISNSTTATNVALPSTATTSNPAKKICEVTTAGGVTTITAPEGSSLQDLAWTLVKSGDNYKFYQEGSEEIRMYLTGLSTNTGLRIGNANSVNDEFVMGDLGQLLKVTTGTRFVGPNDNNGSDWRTYNTENGTNYKGAALTFYVLKASQGGDDPEPETQTVYLNGGGSSLWNQAGAEFFAHTWGGAEAVAVKMTLVEGDVYSAAIPADNNNVVFVRMPQNSEAIDWDNCWNKTEDLAIEGENNLYTITAWGEGGNKVCSGVWSVYDDGGDDPEPPTPAVENGFYLVGTMNSWTPAAEYKFAPAEAEGEYILHTTLAENDEIKVMKVEAGQDDVWYPGGDAANYIVNAAHAGEKDIYFRPAGNEAWAEFGGFIWMGENTTPTADFTQPFTLKFNGTGDGSDRSGTYKVEDGVAALFVAASVPYVSALTTVSNVYAGRIIAEDNSSLKFGTSSKQGTLAFTLAQAIEVDSIIVNATQYGNSAAEVTINGTKFDLTAGNKVPQDCKITPEGEVSTITIEQTGTERIYLRNVRIYPKTQGGGDDPQPETQTVYLNGGGSSLWNQADAEFFAHTWGGAEAVAVKMTLVEGDVYSAAIPADNANIVFVRMAPESSAIDWDNLWNKTEDLTIEGENNLYTITAWGEGDGNKVCAGVWSVYGEGGGDTPEPPAKFYVTGNAALVGEEHQWTPGIIPSENDTLVLNLEAEQLYMLKVTLGEDWTHGVLGYDALSEKPTGIIRGEGDDNDNICFTLAEAGQVKVVYIKGEGEEFTFKMFGNFYVAPVEKDSIFFVNVANWGAVRVHLWGGSAADTEWPGVEMTLEEEQINGHDVYKFIADKGAYANCIFSDKGNNQTGNLDWNSGKYYYVDAWYAKEDIPTVQPEDVVFTVNVPEGTDSVFIAGTFNGWTFEKMNHVEGLQYTITKNIVKDGIEYKYTAGRSWDYVEIRDGNRTAWAELDEVTEWLAVPQAPFEHHDFFITGNAALVGEELAWNPNAIPVDGNSYVLHLGAGKYELKVVTDDCGASNCQQWFGCERLSNEQVEGVACVAATRNIGFTLAEEGNVTVNFVLTETDTIITLTGNFYNVPMVDIKLVPGEVWSLDEAKFAAVIWNVGQTMEYDGVLTGWFVGGDTVVAQIPENTDSIAFARFAPEVETPFLNPNDDNFWNHTDKLAVDPSMIFTVMGGDVEGRNFSPGYWGEKPDFIADGYFLLGNFNGWTADADYWFTPYDENQYKVTVALAVNDELKVAKYDRGYRVQWFPNNADNYVVNEKHAGSAQDIYFRPDYQGSQDWYEGCIYVVENDPTAIDNTAIDAKAEKMLRNGMILIIKGDKTYNVMGQIVK